MIAWILVALTVLLLVYAYAGYPALLWLAGRTRLRAQKYAEPAEWPTVSISLPVYNEAGQIRDLLDSVLRLDYPRDRLQILVISDASSDGSDDIVREYADRGVELLRMPKRAGKTAGENAAAAHLRGEIVINTDASIRIRSDALKPLIARFSDPTVGVASGRDLSVGAAQKEDSNIAEARYVGYEMGVRALETALGGIVGASGCFYAIRAELHRAPLPGHLSRDFASALIAREHGYRAVSVDEAICFVPRTGSLQREYRRKVRTMSRGMETLLHKRHLLNPLRYGRFAWMLLSHKVTRWATPCIGLVALLGLIVFEIGTPMLALLLGGVVFASAVTVIAWRWPDSRPMPRLVSLIASAVLVNAATVHAAIKAANGDENASWEPTRREVPLPTEATRA
jgi:cellulose synthase/poly-beta-1,6-N-acetylglucosamine synthase-like glycosyltransferase